MQRKPYHKRKIWKLLELLTSAEQTRLKHWLEAELIDKQLYVKKLASIVLENSDQPLSEEELWEGIYPEKTYDDARLRKLLRDLSSLVEEFIAIESFRADKSAKNLHLLKQLRLRDAQEVFIQFHKKLTRQQHEAPLKDSSYYRQQYEMTNELVTYQLQYAHSIKPLSFEALNNAFDAWWVHEKLALACANDSSSTFFPHSIQNQLLAQSLHMIQNHPYYEEMTLLQIQWKIYNLLQGTAEGTDLEIQEWITKSASDLPTQTQKEIFELLLNYHIRKLNQSGNDEVAYTLYELYEWGILHKLLIDQNQLHWQQYKNIISICIQTHNFPSAKHYLEELKPYLPGGERQEAYIFNRSQYHFAKKEYEEVLSLLRNRKFGKLIYEIPARATLLQAHYERYGPSQDWLVPQITNLIRYIQQQQLSLEYKESYINRFKLFRRLAQPLTVDALQQLKDDIRNTYPVSRPQWLIEKADERLGEFQRYTKKEEWYE